MVEFKRTLIFLHSPRTGGTTLSTTVGRLFPAHTVFPGILSSRVTLRTLGILWGRLKTPQQIACALTDLSRADKGDLKYVHGHLPFGVHALLPQPCIYFTILRDPVARILSIYHFLSHRPDMDWYDQVKAVGLRGFVSDLDACCCNNGQVRRISGVGWDGPLTPNALEMAKRNLRESFMLVGITERFNETLLLLGEILGVRWQDLLYSKRNVGSHTPCRASDDVVALIRQRNELDLVLYQSAQQMFELAVRDRGSGFQDKLRAFEARLAIYQALPRVRTMDWFRALAIGLHIQCQVGIRRLKTVSVL